MKPGDRVENPATGEGGTVIAMEDEHRLTVRWDGGSTRFVERDNVRPSARAPEALRAD